jgi:small subunit ribosomal protein S14
MKSRILRDIRNRAAVAANEVQRQAYRYIVRNEQLPARIRLQAQLALNTFPRKTRPAHVKNRCLETGRGRGVLRDFRLCRYQFRLQALRGELPGVMKSTW